MTTILIALISVGGAGIGFLASSIKDWISNSQAIKQKWLDDRRTSYIKFISSFSTPYFSEDINITDYMGYLLEAATDAYLYGNQSPTKPFYVKSPLYYLYKSNPSGSAERERMALKLQANYPELKDRTKFDDFINKGHEVTNLFDLILTLSIYRPVIYSTLLHIKGDDDVMSEKKKCAATKFFSDLRQEALGGFMPAFLFLLEEKSKVIVAK